MKCLKWNLLPLRDVFSPTENWRMPDNNYFNYILVYFHRSLWLFLLFGQMLVRVLPMQTTLSVGYAGEPDVSNVEKSSLLGVSVKAANVEYDTVPTTTETRCVLYLLATSMEHHHYHHHHHTLHRVDGTGQVITQHWIHCYRIFLWCTLSICALRNVFKHDLCVGAEFLNYLYDCDVCVFIILNYTIYV